MTMLIRNQTVKQGKGTFVVIDLCRPGVVHEQAAVVVLERNVANPLPIIWPLTYVTRWTERNELCAVEVKETPRPSEERESDKQRRDLRWSRIQDIRDNVALHKRETRNKLLVEHARNIGTTKETLLDDLRRYWLNGQDKAALLGNYWRSGQLNDRSGFSIEVKTAAGERLVMMAAGNGKARGRRPLYQDYEPFVIGQKLHERLVAVAKKLYLESEKKSLRFASEQAIATLFGLRSADGELLRGENGEAILPPLGSRPTVDQIRYRLLQSLSPSEIRRKRTSDAHYENNFASTLGTVHDDSLGAADVYELDATIVDLWLVSRYNRAKIIGKATLYLVIDRSTGLIVGFYLSLDNPHFEGAKQAVLSVANDWRAICKKHGIAYDARAFPAIGRVPNRIVMDRGDGQVTRSGIFCENLAIPVTNLPGFMSKLKGSVEGSFHLIQTPIRDHVGGATLPKQAKERRGPKYEHDARFTLDDLYKAILRIIIKNNMTPRASVEVFPQDVARGALRSPAQKFVDDVKESMGMGRSYTREALARKLRPVGEADVTQSGVRFNGINYAFEDFNRLDWGALASLQGQFPVKVTYWPDWLNEITVYDPHKAGVTYTAKMTSKHSKHFSGFSVGELNIFRLEARALKKAGAELEMAHRIALGEDLKELDRNAAAATALVAKGMTLGQRKAGGPELRKKEKLERRADTFGSAETGWTDADEEVPQSSTTSALEPTPDAEPSLLSSTLPPEPAYDARPGKKSNILPKAMPRATAAVDSMASPTPVAPSTPSPSTTSAASSLNELLADFDA